MAHCYACNEAEIIPLWEHGRTLHARALGESAQLYVCPLCGHKQFVPDFPIHKLADVYASSYSTEDERASYGSQYALPSSPYLEFAERIGELARLYGLKPGARMHEFGCGAGITVHLLRKMGFDATGSDWSAGAVSFARENGNDFVTREDMSTLANSEPLDMVLNLHAIEHVPRPIEVLRNFVQIMKPEALLYLNTNQGQSIVNQCFGMHFDSWYYYPQHLHYFGPRSFEKFAGREGLKPLMIGTTPRRFDQTDVAGKSPDELADDMEGQEMEMLCALTSSAHEPLPFKTPDPPPVSDADGFDDDSHASYFERRRSWSYWTADAETLKPIAQMLYSKERDYYYYSPSHIGDHWMLQVHEGPAPMLQYVASQSGVALIEVKAALRYLNQPHVEVIVHAPGQEPQRVVCDSTAPETISIQARVSKGDRFRIIARTLSFPNNHRLIIFAGISYLSLHERAEGKVGRFLRSLIN